MKQELTALAAGIVFALGLGIAGMTLPEKVMGFLDFTGNWDPSLAFVMVGAIGVNALVWWILVRRREKPLFAEAFQLPTRTEIDWRLIVGATLFGVGWGLGGYCPGPGVASMFVGGRSVALFVGAMLAGMWLFGRVESRVTPERR